MIFFRDEETVFWLDLKRFKVHIVMKKASKVDFSNLQGKQLEKGYIELSEINYDEDESCPFSLLKWKSNNEFKKL